MKRIAHVTDLHLEEAFPIDNGVDSKSNLNIILEGIVNRGITEVVFTGDIGTAESNQWFFDTIHNYPVSLKLTLGNHDDFSVAIKYYKNYLRENRNELYYSDEDANYKYIYLDTSSCIISDTQLGWFKKELIASDKRVILFIHHPILETNTAPQRDYSLEGSDKIQELLLSFNHDVDIFCGHLHMEDDRAVRNITQHITPASCYQIKKQEHKIELDNINFGYRVIEIHKDQVSSEVVMFSN